MIGRRELLGIGSAALASCGGRERYFGKATPPPTQTLVYEIGGEPSSLDPATCLGMGDCEGHVMPALFEGLGIPRSAYTRSRSRVGDTLPSRRRLTEFTFFLRGHLSPTGTKLPGAGGATGSGIVE